jgi:hypothetical protein
MSDQFSSLQQPWLVLHIDEMKTLPLFVLKARTLEVIRPYTQGKVELLPIDTDYENYSYDLSPEWLARIATDPAEASQMVRKWGKHQSELLFFVQFRDDPTRQKLKALHDHTALISALCDARLAIDTADLWIIFDNLLLLDIIYMTYRADEDREAKYDAYANKVITTHDSVDTTRMTAVRLLDRIARQIDLKTPVWATLPPIRHASRVMPEGGKVRLFYSYSHRDERLRDKLETHLAVLKRNGVIENWHDRRIGA